MRITRTHIDQTLTPGALVDLPSDVVGHLGRVLRAQPGDTLILFNGDGNDYLARLETIDKRIGTARIESASIRESESPVSTTLVQSVVRGDKMDWILQKATELGVNSIRPVYSQRGEIKLDAARTAKRLEHWQQVVISACEQSGRARIPQVLEPVPLQRLETDQGDRLYLDPGADRRLHDLQPDNRHRTLAIGPEGGWSDVDLRQLADLGFSGARLGPRILRTETAGLAALAALQTLYGDF